MKSQYPTGLSIDAVTCNICGYNPPFCACHKFTHGLVTCGQCKHFKPDEIGDGSGVGKCDLGIIMTRVPRFKTFALYRYADRYCDKFENNNIL